MNCISQFTTNHLNNNYHNDDYIYRQSECDAGGTIALAFCSRRCTSDGASTYMYPVESRWDGEEAVEVTTPPACLQINASCDQSWLSTMVA